MKNFFALIGLLVVLFIGVGIWQNWFKFAINSDNKVTTEFDAKKASQDAKQAGDAVKNKLEDLKKKGDESDSRDTSERDTTPSGTKLVDTPGPLFGNR